MNWNDYKYRRRQYYRAEPYRYRSRQHRRREWKPTFWWGVKKDVKTILGAAIIGVFLWILSLTGIGNLLDNALGKFLCGLGIKKSYCTHPTPR